MDQAAATIDATSAPGRPAPGGRCPSCGATTRPVRAVRRFALGDVMILVAASGLALALARPALIDSPGWSLPPWGRLLAIVIAGLATWTPALLVLQLREPRPTLRRLARRPGFAASSAGSMVLAAAAVAIGLLGLIRLSRHGTVARPADPSLWIGVVFHFAPAVGPAVLAAWLILALTGRRRPAGGWVDHLGRLVGALWIALFVINCCIRLAYLAN